MSVYENFSEVYDIFMEEVPYIKWVDYIEKIWLKYNLDVKLVAELGCGTGNITIPLAKKGYDMIGVDLSDQMLNKAQEKSKNLELDILFLLQDMTEFELYGTVDSVVSICDSINYILEEDELLEVFRLVNNYLNPNGLFIFDMNTEHKFKNVLADNTFSDTSENSAYTLENFYDEEEMINEFYTNFFLKDEETGLYNRFEEIHHERAYTVETIKILLEKSGLKFIGAFDELTFNEFSDKSERIFFVARENGKLVIDN